MSHSSASRWHRLRRTGGISLVVNAAILLVSVTLLSARSPAQADALASYQVYGSHRARNADAFSAVPPAAEPYARTTLLQRLRFLYQADGLRLLLNGSVDTRAGKGTRGTLELNELVYETSWLGFDLTFGKKILGYGVGYAFRPLDLLQRENRRRLILLDLDGVPVLGIERFLSEVSVSLFYANRGSLEGSSVQLGDHELTLRYYQSVDIVDLHGLLHWREPDDISGGLGGTAVPTEWLELHASARVSSDCRVALHALRNQRRGLLSDEDPVELVSRASCVALVFGSVVTLPARLAIMLELIHDGNAPSIDDWKRLRALARAQRALVGPYPAQAVHANLLFSQRLLAQPSLLQQHIFVRLAFDHPDLRPAVDALISPLDGGLVLTATVDYHPWPTATVSASLRWFTGASGAVYREMVDRFQFFIGLGLDHGL
jgi:hypothetical protein